MHVLLDVAAAVIAIIPILAVSLAYRRSHSRRLALALVAIIALEVRAVSMVLIRTLFEVDHFVEEMLEFAGDLAVMVAFAFAFLYGTGWWFGRVPTEAP